MKNGWTGGQYSVFRIPLGLYVGALFLATMAWGGHVRLTERADSLSVFARYRYEKTEGDRPYGGALMFS